MHVDPEALMALAGLEPMPRRPLSINPCPPGYELKLIGGNLTCVLEGADQLDPLKAQMMAAAGYTATQAGLLSSRSFVPTNYTTHGAGGGPQGAGGGR